MIELIGDVNLKRYMGTWLKIARKPAFLQRSCVQSKAEYQLEYEDSTPVINIKSICVKKDGEVSQVQGKAEVKSPRALSVKFSTFMNFFNKADYEILFIDTNYEVAVVGSPGKEYLWILSREIVDRKEIDELLDVARQKGFDISDIVFNKY